MTFKDALLLLAPTTKMQHTRYVRIPFAFLLSILLAGGYGVLPAIAQTALGPTTIGGVGAMTGGRFTLRATVGQPAASTRAGGGEALGEGFWYATRLPDLINTALEDDLEAENLQLPTTLSLDPVYPNPVRGRATVQYRVPPPGETLEISVYDVIGRHVKTLVQGFRAPGHESVTLATGDLATGLYYIRLNNAVQAQVQRLIVVR